MAKTKYNKGKLMKDVDGWGEKGDILNIKEGTCLEEIEDGMIEILEEPMNEISSFKKKKLGLVEEKQEQTLSETIKIEDIKNFYEFLEHKEETEIRFFDENKKATQTWVNNFDSFLNYIKKYNGLKNLYVGLNERELKGDSDVHVKEIRFIGHDIDAHSGKYEDLQTASEVAQKIQSDCVGKGMEKPLMFCSGRGFWIIHKIVPIENTLENVKKIKEFGKWIKNKYEVPGIELDSSVYNPSRIVRIPGTINISHPDKFVGFIGGDYSINADEKLKNKILGVEIEKPKTNLNAVTPKSSCGFMDYCLTHEIPEGERHKTISRNMALYISEHPDREKLREHYIQIQKGSEKELDGWLKNIDENGKEKYPFSCGELINFQKKYGIPSKCKGCPKLAEFKKDKKAEKNLEKAVKQNEKPEGKFLFQEFGQFTNFLETAKRFCISQPIYYDKGKIWWLWNFKDLKWEMIDETDLLNTIDNYTKTPTANSKVKNEILEALKRTGRRNKPKDAKKTWVQFKDIVVDIETGEKFKASPEYFITNPIPWNYVDGEELETPIIDKIFEEWVGEDYVKTLYEIMAYCLLPNYPIHRIFCFVGEGLNGKSKYLELLRLVIGEDNCCATELDDLLNSRFEITRLHNKLVCQMGETDFNEMNKTAILKKLCGNDFIGIEYKNKDLIHTINYAKILIATNNLPTTTDKTIGFYRRWCILDFPNQFSEKKDILKDIPEEEIKILSTKLIKVLKELLEKREFHNEGNINERMKKYESKSDFLKTFLFERTEEFFDGKVHASFFNKEFENWCGKNKFRKLSASKVVKLLKEKGFVKEKIYDEQTKKMNWFYTGLNWRSI